jgi:ribosome-associated protein
MNKYPEKVVEICNFLNEKKASDIVVCDVSKKKDFVKYFIVATFDSTSHIRETVDFLMENTMGGDFSFWQREGFNMSEWVVLDYYDVFVHLFTKNERNHYSFDKLMSGEASTQSYKRILSDIQKQQKSQNKSKGNDKK